MMDTFWTQIQKNTPAKLKENLEDIAKYGNWTTRLKSFLDALNLDENWFKGKSVLDIGGGSFALREGSTQSFPVFYPWMGLILKFLGAESVKVIDSFDDQTLINPDMQNLIDLFLENISLINFDLLNLLKSEGDINMIESDSLDFVNSNLVVSLKNPYGLSSPSLRLNLDQLDMEKQDENNPYALLTIKILKFVFRVLKNGGIFLFNNEIYRKVGDDLIWVKSLVNKSGDRETYKELVGQRALDEAGNPYPERTKKQMGEVKLTVKNGRWEHWDPIDHPFEPMP